jgi:hypothetical protein
MSVRLYTAELLHLTSKCFLRIGEFLETSPVAILRPVDIVEWVSKSYNRHSVVFYEQNDPN